MTVEQGLTIRLACENDLAAVLKLYTQDDFNGDAIGLAQAQALYRRNFQTPGYQMWLTELEGEIVGTACLMIMENIAAMGRHSAFIESVVVDQSVRGLGIGQALMKRLCKEAEGAGAYKICLFTSPKSHYVHKFYEDLGFKRHGISYQLATNVPEAA